MKKIIFFSLAVLLVASCGKVDDKYYGKETTSTDNTVADPGIVWADAADQATDALITKFWYNSTGTRGYFNGVNNGTGGSWGYWPQAHAMDVVIDAYIRSNKDASYLPYFDKWYLGVKSANGGSYYNVFFDDMEWIAMTMIRMYEVTEDAKYLASAKELWGWIIAGYTDEEGGGILWSVESGRARSKNACSNGPGSLVASRLYQNTTDETQKAQYKADAIKVYNWLKSVLYDQTTGAIADNILNGVSGGVPLSYNQGTFVGAANELYKITNDRTYLLDAIKAANYTITSAGMLDSQKLLLRDEGAGDGGLFKGIFIRYFVQLANNTDVDKATRQKFHKFISNNAITAWTKGVDTVDEQGMLFTGIWDTPAYQTTELGYQVSGCTLIEAMCALKPVL